MNNSINKYIIKEEIEFLIKQNRSMRTEDNFIDEVFNLEEVLKNRYKGEENAKLIDEYLINEYKQVRDIFRTKAFSQFINIYVHLCLIVYNKLTKQNSETIDHWTYEISQFFNEINNNRFSTKDKIKLLETVFTDFSKNSKVINSFFYKIEKEAKSNKRFNLINKTKEVVAMVVFEHFDVIFTTIKNCITNNEPLILDKNYISDFIKICKLNL